MRRFICIVLLLWNSYSYSQAINEPQCIRLDYFFALKKKTAEAYWPGFDAKLLYGPMIFYSNAGTYVINPNKKLKERLKYTEVKNCLRHGFIGKVVGMIDTTHFNMQVDYDEEDSTALHFFNAVASVSDIGIARIFVPKINNIEEWMGMILHESFHLYQTSFPAFKEYQNSTQKVFSRDTLLFFYEHEDWYKDAINKEYDLLLHALDSKDQQKTVVYIENFLNSRDQRFKKISLKYGVDVRALEDMLERSEGVARYMEYCMKRVVKDIPFIPRLQLTDTLYHFGEYARYDMEPDPFMNKPGKQYFYAIGLNLARLLESRHINFTNMYRDNIPFENYLERIGRQ